MMGLTSVVHMVDDQQNQKEEVISFHPCGGGFEYLHRDSASRRRRRKGKSQIWDTKIWSWVPRDSDPRKPTLARASSIYKRQTRPLVREGALQKQGRNCQMGLDTKTYWLTDRQSQCDFDSDFVDKIDVVPDRFNENSYRC
jgi:hypothetical protein